MPFTQSQTQDIVQIIKATINELLEGDMLTKIVESVLDKINITEIKTQLSTQEEKIIELEQENKKLVNKLNIIDQEIRHTNIRIYGIPEEKNEDTEKKVLDVFNKKLKLNISSLNIDKVHRIGKLPSKKNRAIMVSLTTHKVKKIIIKDRKLLKGSGIIIAEDMAQDKHQILKEAVEKIGKKQVWALDGIIYTQINNKKYIIKTLDDVTKYSRL